MDQDSLPPTTTKEQDTVTAGQRKVNIIWETTQRLIALIIVSFTVVALFIVSIGLSKIDTNQLTALLQLVAMSLLVLGFYFSRTNHTQIGGVGKKATDNQNFKGR